MKEKIIPGDMLDDRYEIRKILRSEEQVTLYEGYHHKIEKRVLILELCDAETTHILAKSRQLGDLSGDEGIFHINDQFIGGDKAYIIFDYPEGKKLKEFLQEEKKIEEKKLTEMILPVIHVLVQMEKEEMDKLPINSENLYVKPNGKLCLFPDLTGKVSALKSYSYTICELMYEAVSGTKPQSLEIRILFDELLPLSQCSPGTDKKFSSLIEKGMNIEPDSSYLSISELQELLQEWMGIQEQKKNRWIYGLMGVILMGALLCAGSYGIYKKFEEEILFLGTKTETLLLKPSEDMSQKNYVAAIDVIKNRIKNLSDSARYLVKDDNGWIRVTVPEELYDRYNLQNYLSYSLKLRAGVMAHIPNPSDQLDDETDSYYQNFMWTGVAVEIEPEDIVDVHEIDNNGELGKWETYEGAYAELGKWETYGEIEDRLLVVTVTDNVTLEMKEKFESKIKALGELEEDYETAFVIYFDGLEKGAEANILNNDWHILYINETNDVKIISTLLQDKTFEENFDVSEELSADWIEKLSDVYVHWKDEEEIKDPAVCLEYYSAIAPENDGDFYYSLGHLADKLESLKIPYAIGQRGEDRKNLVVKVRQKDMTEFLAQVLSENTRCKVEDQWGNSQSIEEISQETDADGNHYWSVKVNWLGEDAAEILNSDGYIYLTYGDYPIARTKIEEMPQNFNEDGLAAEYKIDFKETWLGNDEIISKDMNSLIRLISVSENQGYSWDVPQSYYLSEIQYTEKEKAVHEKQSENKSLVFTDRNYAEIKQNAEELDSYIETEVQYRYAERYSAGCALIFTLHIDVDSAYAEEAVKKIRQLYKACNLEEAKYKEITFYIGEKKESPRVHLSPYSSEKKWSSYVSTRGNQDENAQYDTEFEEAFEQAVTDGKFGDKIKMS